jgi:hypothetical protein
MGCAETKPPGTSGDQPPQPTACCPQAATATTNGPAVCSATASGSSRSTPSPPPHEFLSPAEKAIILADWNRLLQRDPVRHQEMGYRIFLRIFELAPSARLTFDAFRDVVGRDQLLENSTFRMHATRFMRVVAGVVDNIDDLDVIVVPNLIQLGRIHRTISSEKILREHFDAFEQAMTEVWALELRNRSQGASDCNGVNQQQQQTEEKKKKKNNNNNNKTKTKTERNRRQRHRIDGSR